MAEKNSAPLSGLSWNITCPMPRRLVSMNRRADDDARTDTQPDKYAFHLNSPSWAVLARLAPEERGGIAAPVISRARPVPRTRALSPSPGPFRARAPCR